MSTEVFGCGNPLELGNYGDNYAACLRAIGKLNRGNRREGLGDLRVIHDWIVARREPKSLRMLLGEVERVLRHAKMDD